MNLLIPILQSGWDVLAVMRTILIYVFPVFVFVGHYIEQSSVEQMILVWGGVFTLLTLPAAIAVGRWRALATVIVPLVLVVVIVAFTVVLRSAANEYIAAAYTIPATNGIQDR